MSFCIKCGNQVLDETGKFCHKCGAPLSLKMREDKQKNIPDTETIVSKGKRDVEAKAVEDRSAANPESEQRGSRAYELGDKLEKAVEKILRAEGYSTERRKRLTSEKGKSEIDIVATKMHKGYKEELVVECKNYSSPIPVIAVRDFESKMVALGKKNGLFAAIPDFSRDAAQWGESIGLELWSWDIVKEKLAEIEIGRLGSKEIGKVEFHLPLDFDYEKAVKLGITNPEKVQIENVKLIWKPYYRLSYTLKCIRTDPRKQKHTIEDSGKYIIDGLSGTFLQKSSDFNIAINELFRGQSAEDSQKVRENNVFLQELLEQEPETDLSLIQSAAYRTIIHKTDLTEERVKKTIFNDIVKANTRVEYYKLKKDEDDLFADSKEFKVEPSVKDIRVLSLKLIYVPTWEIEFQSKEYRYTRKMSGNSGKILFDTITYCNKHVNKNIDRKINIAACDVCGEVLCKEHVWQCSICGSWRCATHSKTCISCQKRYCPEHITIKCADCNSDVCDSCAVKCPICGQSHCKTHMTKCSRCGKTVCTSTSCTRKVGGILSIGQKVYCKNC